MWLTVLSAVSMLLFSTGLDAQTAANLSPARVQKILEKAAKAKQYKPGAKTGALTVVSSTVRDHQFTLRMTHPAASTPSEVQEAIASWPKAFGRWCNVQEFKPLIDVHKVKFTFSLESPSGLPLTTVDINSSTCPHLRSLALGLPSENTLPVKVIPGNEKLPFFEFKGVTAGRLISYEQVGQCGNSPLDAPFIQCTPPSFTVAGLNVFLSMRFYKNRLHTVAIRHENSSFDTIKAAFIEKYGQPCETSEPKWQNRAGASFDNLKISWCFASGKLDMSLRGVKVDELLVVYTDINGPEQAVAPVDF